MSEFDRSFVRSFVLGFKLFDICIRSPQDERRERKVTKLKTLRSTKEN